MATDARTFHEIWESLTAAQAADLRESILSKTGASSNTFWFWKTGTSSPASRNDRRTIARLVTATLGIAVHEATLFPRRR